MRAVIHFKGKPYSKQAGHRSYLDKNAQKIRFYSTGEYDSFKTALGWEAAAQLRKQGWVTEESDPVWISVMFKSNHNLGDVSNMLGGIEDALNGLAWADDCQAVIRSCFGAMLDNQDEVELTIVLEKFFGTEPHAPEIRAWVKDGLKRRLKRCKARSESWSRR